VLAAISFGSTFIPVQDAIRRVGPVPFLGVRFLTGTVLLGAFLIHIGGWSRLRRRPVIRGGLAAGIPLVIGYILQTIGLKYTTTPVSAFITYLLVVFVPLFGALWNRRWPSRSVVGGVVLATLGLFLLTGAHLHLGLGELLTLGCAVSFAVNILEIDRAVGANPDFQDVIALAVVQLATVAVGCLIPGLWLGGYRLPGSALAAAVYTGVACSALAFGLQVWGQRRVGPTRTALLLMIEPVTAAMVGWAAGQPLGPIGLAGAGLILVGILLSEARPSRD
jgi:drug/metabolite transporter (DMT)-like permease